MSHLQVGISFSSSAGVLRYLLHNLQIIGLKFLKLQEEEKVQKAQRREKVRTDKLYLTKHRSWQTCFSFFGISDTYHFRLLSKFVLVNRQSSKKASWKVDLDRPEARALQTPTSQRRKSPNV